MHFDVFLIKRGLRIHDITVDLVSFMGQLSVLTLHLLKLALEHLGVARLLLNLRFVVLTQVANAVLKGDTSLRHLLDPQLQLLVEGLEIRTGLQLPTIARNDLIVDALGAPDIYLSATDGSDLLRVLNDSRSGRGALPGCTRWR